MGYFHETGEGRQIEMSAKEFCQNVIRKDFDKFAKAKKFPREVFEKMGSRGFLGAMVPEEYGGTGMRMQDYVVLMESVACYGGGSIALTLTAHHSLAVAHIIHAGTDEQKITFLPKLASGEMIGAWCLTGPDAGSDAFGKGMRTTATLTNSGWLLNGPKQFVTNGSIADVYVVIAKIVSGDPNLRKHGVFIVPRSSKGLIQCRTETNKMGMHASDTAAVTFENVEIGADAYMGDGKSSTKKVLNNGRVGISALACGLMRSSLSEAVAYTKERQSFSKPLAEYQGISFPLADASAALTSSWAMVEKAALAVDRGMLSTELASETKLIVTINSFKACLAADDVFGGYGYLLDYRVTQDFCDSRLLQIGEGTDNMQRLAIAKELFTQ